MSAEEPNRLQDLLKLLDQTVATYRHGPKADCGPPVEISGSEVARARKVMRALTETQQAETWVEGGTIIVAGESGTTKWEVQFTSQGGFWLKLDIDSAKDKWLHEILRAAKILRP